MNHLLQTVLSVGIGGAIGALLRTGMRPIALSLFPLFPQMGTVIVNLIGCFCIGIFAAIFDKVDTIPHGYQLFLFWGVLGAFTTFSTYGLDTINLITSGQFKLAALYLALSNIVGIGLVFIGYKLGLILFSMIAMMGNPQ